MHGRQIDPRRARVLRAVAPMCCLGIVALVGCSSETRLPQGSGAAQESTSTSSVGAEVTSTLDASPSTVAPATAVEAPTTSANATVASGDVTTTSVAETTGTVIETAAPPPSAAPPGASSDIRLPVGTVVSMSWPAAADGWALVDDADGRRTLVHTTDGATWAPAGGEATGDLQVAFGDETNGWVVAADGLSSTHDGGATWNAVPLQGSDAVAAVATANGLVHVAYLAIGGGAALTVATSPIDRDEFTSSPLHIPVGAGPLLDVSMTAGGPYSALIYNDRVVVGAAQIANGQWSNWNLACPYANPFALVGLSPQGKNLVVACAPSGFGDNEAIVGLNLNGGGSTWVDIVPAGGADTAMATLDFVAATDAGVRIVGYTKPDGSGELAASTDGGATWTQRTPLPAASVLSAVASLPGGSVIVDLGPSGGLISADGLTWTPVPAAS